MKDLTRPLHIWYNTDMLEKIIERVNGKTLGALAVLLIAQQMPQDRYILYGIAIVIASLRDPCCKQAGEKQ